MEFDFTINPGETVYLDKSLHGASFIIQEKSVPAAAFVMAVDAPNTDPSIHNMVGTKFNTVAALDTFTFNSDGSRLTLTSGYAAGGAKKFRILCVG